jgi:hypothetical protein
MSVDTREIYFHMISIHYYSCRYFFLKSGQNLLSMIVQNKYRPYYWNK